MEHYSPEVQQLMNEVSAQLSEALSSAKCQTIEEQAEIIKKSLADMLTHNDVPNKVEVTPRGNGGEVDIKISVPIEWSWLFDGEDNDIDWGYD